MDKHTIINLKKSGISDRKVAALLKISRNTVSKYWKRFNRTLSEINEADAVNVPLLQEELLGKPRYDTSNRAKIKYTKEIDQLLDEILEEENEKNELLGKHKQKLTQLQIYQRILDAGHDIGKTTISMRIKEKRDRKKECFIKQSYSFGDRLEYDFGEVKLLIDDEVRKLYMAVLASPAGVFKWAYLYTNQKQDVFMDSHACFFEMVGGSYKEVVYDNMKNVVKKFIGRSEKQLNSELILLADYYGFNINVTNCFKANEKGYVENSVKTLRNQIFAQKYKFESIDEAREYLNIELNKINAISKIEEEKPFLLPKKVKLAIGRICRQSVNSYSFVQVDKCFYSVPDYLVGKEVTIRVFPENIRIYSKNQLASEHKKVDGVNKTSIDIRHYLPSLTKKPGALRNSLALKSIPQLKSIYDNHFIKNPKLFIDILTKNKEKTIEELISFFETYRQFSFNVTPLDIIPSQDLIDQKAIMQISKYEGLYLRATREATNGN